MDQPDTLATIAHQTVTFADGMVLECGVRLQRLDVAYRTYGTLNAARSNAVLVCHALTGDQYVAEPHPITGKEGWWEAVVGPGSSGGHRSLLRRLRQRAGWLHGLDRPAQRDGVTVMAIRTPGAPSFRRSPSATWFARRSG